MGLMTR